MFLILLYEGMLSAPIKIAWNNNQNICFYRDLRKLWHLLSLLIKISGPPEPWLNNTLKKWVNLYQWQACFYILSGQRKRRKGAASQTTTTGWQHDWDSQPRIWRCTHREPCCSTECLRSTQSNHRQMEGYEPTTAGGYQKATGSAEDRKRGRGFILNSSFLYWFRTLCLHFHIAELEFWNFSFNALTLVLLSQDLSYIVNSGDPDWVSSEAIWSGSTLFGIQLVNLKVNLNGWQSLMCESN